MKGQNKPSPKWVEDPTARPGQLVAKAMRLEFEASDGTAREVVAYRVLAGIRIEHLKPDAAGAHAELLLGETLSDLGKGPWSHFIRALSAKAGQQEALVVQSAGPPPITLDAPPPPILQTLPVGTPMVKRGLDSLEAGAQLRELEQKLKTGQIGSAVALSRAFQVGREHEAYLIDQQEQERSARLAQAPE